MVGAVLALGVIVAAAAPAAAHPLGNFTVNRYARVELSAGVVRVYYVLDDALAARLGLRSVHFAGLQQIATRHYAAGFPTDVLTFRPTG